ncbi:MAG: glycosyltransferase family protein [Candidatus Marinarcus sp.]|uniref:glycosyltransferase family protein n=1 Tax=Candidatus Marinarcus sp. TaxID=3100987 RepID=UPI003AFFAEBC
MQKSLKIVHCAIFSQFKNGEAFYAMDRKISHGLIQNGHFVYDFSYRDVARVQRILGFKQRSIDKMNQDLLKTCENINPELLLLGKAEMIYPETLEKIKRKLPNIKIVKWFVDFLKTEKSAFFEQFQFIDAFFQTTATELYELSRKYKNTVFSYLPNISDPSIDRKIDRRKEYDVLYIARDYKADVRTEFANLLKDFCEKENINLRIYGSLGNPTIFGNNYQEEISKSKIAINFNREDKLDDYNRTKILGSSDRMNHFLGSGTCTFSPHIISMDKLYKKDKEVIYFNNIEECFKKLKYYLKDNRFENVGLSGQKKAYSMANAKRVSQFIVDVSFQKELSEKYEWEDYIFKFEEEK